MSLFDPRPPRAEAAALAALPPDAVRFVTLLRVWLGAPERRADVWDALAGELGAAAGRRALAAFERYLEAAAEGASRRIVRRAVGDPWVSGDEAALAAALRAPHRAPVFIAPEARAVFGAAAAALAEALGAPAAFDDAAELDWRGLRRFGLGGG